MWPKTLIFAGSQHIAIKHNAENDFYRQRERFGAKRREEFPQKNKKNFLSNLQIVKINVYFKQKKLLNSFS